MVPKCPCSHLLRRNKTWQRSLCGPCPPSRGDFILRWASVTLCRNSCYFPGSPSVCPWATHLPSLGLGFLIYKMEMIKAPTPRRPVGIK